MSARLVLLAALTAAAATLALAMRAALAWRAARPAGIPLGERLALLGARVRPHAGTAGLRERLESAGWRDPRAVDLYLAARAIALVGALAVALVLSRLLADWEWALAGSAVLLAFGLVGPRWYLAMRASSRRAAIELGFPGAVELLVTCMDAGMGFEQAFARVAGELFASEPVLADELGATVAELEAGRPLAAALQRLSRRVQLDEVTSFCALLGQAGQLGAPLGATLRQHVYSLRGHRIARLEEHAGRMAARLTLPVTLCLLPATMLLVLGPAILLAMESIGGGR